MRRGTDRPRATRGRLLTALAAGVLLASGLSVGGPVGAASAQSGAGPAILASGYGFACVTGPGGTVRCWGYNFDGQLGIGTRVDSLRPVQVTGLTGITGISASASDVCAWNAAGAAWCWGDNGYGQVGDGTTTLRTVPTRVAGLPAVAAVSMGGQHACALTAAGKVWCWGRNSFGQLGIGSTASPVLAPQQLASLPAASSVSAGDLHTCAVTAAVARCWGYNNDGELGDGTTTNRTSPVQVKAVTKVASVSAGSTHSCAVTSGGKVWCWGDNGFGEVSDGTTITPRTTPVLLKVSGVKAVAAGWQSSCSLFTAGAVSCWGYNANGQVGDGTVLDRHSPLGVSHVTGMTAISASGTVCAARSTGWVLCWGVNFAGGAGDGTTVPALEPAAVRLPRSDGRVAFARANQVYTVASTGGAVTKLTTSGKNYWPRWSPDGLRIAYVNEPTAGVRDIWVMNADGSAKSQVTHVGNATAPTWSPSGLWIAFGTPLQKVRTTAPYGTTVPITGGCSAPGSDPLDVIGPPAWGPDGRQLAFYTSYGCSSPDFYLDVVHLDTTTVDLIDMIGGACCGEGYFDHPGWSPDGSSLVMDASLNSDVDPVFRPSELYVGFTLLPGTIPYDKQPSYSPSGHSLLFVNDASGTAQVVVAAADATGRRTLTQGYNPDWQPVP